MDQPQVWCRRAVERAAPVGLLLYSLVVLWFGTVGYGQWRAVATTWYRARATPSFGAMLATLRRELLHHNLVSQTPMNQAQTLKTQALLIELVARAA